MKEEVGAGVNWRRMITEAYRCLQHGRYKESQTT